MSCASHLGDCGCGRKIARTFQILAEVVAYGPYCPTSVKPRDWPFEGYRQEKEIFSETSAGVTGTRTSIRRITCFPSESFNPPSEGSSLVSVVIDGTEPPGAPFFPPSSFPGGSPVIVEEISDHTYYKLTRVHSSGDYSTTLIRELSDGFNPASELQTRMELATPSPFCENFPDMVSTSLQWDCYLEGVRGVPGKLPLFNSGWSCGEISFLRRSGKVTSPGVSSGINLIAERNYRCLDRTVRNYCTALYYKTHQHAPEELVECATGPLSQLIPPATWPNIDYWPDGVPDIRELNNGVSDVWDLRYWPIPDQNAPKVTDSCLAFSALSPRPACCTPPPPIL
jgi:hypothetical protein